MSVISQNITHLRSLLGISQENLAENLGITRGKVSSYEEGRAEPNIETLIKLSKFFHVAVDALIKSDLRRTDIKSLFKVGENRLLFPVMLDKDNNELIELIPLKASAGYLNGYADPEYFDSVPRMSLPFVPAGKHRAFGIKGDSMPPLREGSFVVGKYVESINDVKDGNTYVMLTRTEGVVYKRVFRDPKNKHIFHLHSDNKVYHPYEVKAEDVLEVWEYICSLNIGAYKEDELNPASILNMLKALQVEVKSIRQGK
ncbi:MAG: LexA family transcriptional regulator [Bacteroidetes bacterium]|nr:LexA family transcriptional regulator [Bacteroidota bacterium]